MLHLQEPGLALLSTAGQIRIALAGMKARTRCPGSLEQWRGKSTSASAGMHGQAQEQNYREPGNAAPAVTR